MKQLTFQRNDESLGMYEIIHVIRRNGELNDEIMAQINQHHLVEKYRYSYGFISESELPTLLSWRISKLPEKWDLLIVSIKHIRHHRMDGAPDWVIRRPQDFYLSEAIVDIIYAGEWDYENATSDN